MQEFTTRQIGPRDGDVERMIKKIGVKSLQDLIKRTIPESIKTKDDLAISEAFSEDDYHQQIKEIGAKNKVFKSYIGLGYYDTILPAVIKRNILENPSWYTPYTPYQAEISQGRLEALLNFQTMVMELTGMELANASLLDEATAVSEAMIMMYNTRSRSLVKRNAKKLFVDSNVFLQSIEVIKGKAEPLGIEVVIEDYELFTPTNEFFGAIIQYPAADGKILDYKEFVSSMHEMECMVTAATDLLSLTLITPPGEWGADVVVGSSQRFGVPMGYGGPHAAFYATREKFKRHLPGRIIGISRDNNDNYALRMALQTREQHIKRERATSNICTAQALLATMASMYAVYHGPHGLKKMAARIHSFATWLAEELEKLGFHQLNQNYFDTLKIRIPINTNIEDIKKRATARELNLWYADDQTIQISLGERINMDDIKTLLEVFSNAMDNITADEMDEPRKNSIQAKFLRKSPFLTEDVFNMYHSETEMMRYIKKLERKDYSLTDGMIPLGSCTMKLNAANELFHLSWPEFMDLHPFIPADQALGYQTIIQELENDLKELTGFEGFTFMPNSGASGEYTGLMIIRAHHIENGESNRNIVLIPSSAHGTNPASGIMAGMKVIIVECDKQGNISLEDLKRKAEENKENLAAFMVTYPSTHGVFESHIVEITNIIHQNGGQVYFDGANMNAQMGLTNPLKIGADVCHLNLHKTFAIPHGGGGPGVGPVGVAKHLVKFLPEHPFAQVGGENAIKPVSASPYGSSSILPISHAYIKMLGPEGLLRTSKIAILNANYIAARLKEYYKILYKGEHGFVGHEMILDCRPFRHQANITEADIAKRLMDYGFHAPTLSFPVNGTLMVEPTESESIHELNRFVEAMTGIYHEIMEIKEGKADEQDNVLKNAPHTYLEATSDDWSHPYTRKKAVFPVRWLEDNKFWPAVARVNDAYGDRNLMCSCKPMDEYRKEMLTFDEGK